MIVYDVTFRRADNTEGVERIRVHTKVPDAQREGFLTAVLHYAHGADTTFVRAVLVEEEQ